MSIAIEIYGHIPFMWSVIATTCGCHNHRFSCTQIYTLLSQKLLVLQTSTRLQVGGRVPPSPLRYFLSFSTSNSFSFLPLLHLQRPQSQLTCTTCAHMDKHLSSSSPALPSEVVVQRLCNRSPVAHRCLPTFLRLAFLINGQSLPYDCCILVHTALNKGSESIREVWLLSVVHYLLNNSEWDRI